MEAQKKNFSRFRWPLLSQIMGSVLPYAFLSITFFAFAIGLKAIAISSELSFLNEKRLSIANVITIIGLLFFLVLAIASLYNFLSKDYRLDKARKSFLKEHWSGHPTFETH